MAKNYSEPLVPVEIAAPIWGGTVLLQTPDEVLAASSGPCGDW